MDIGQVLIGVFSGIMMGIPLGVTYCKEIRELWVRIVHGPSNGNGEDTSRDAEHPGG